MYEQPTKGDLDRNLSTIFHSAHQKARAERGRLTSEFAARGMATSTSLIGAMIGVLDTIHKDAIGQAMPLLRDFAERMQIPAIEITALARPHLENLGSSVLGQLLPAGFPGEHQRIRAQYTAVFQQRLDGALRDFEIGFIGGRNIGVQAKGDDSAPSVDVDEFRGRRLRPSCSHDGRSPAQVHCGHAIECGGNAASLACDTGADRLDGA